MKKEIITNYKVYDLEETLVASGYAMIEEYSEKTVKKEALDSIDAYINNEEDYSRHLKRALKLAKAPLNSGHVSFAKGIVVNMDIIAGLTGERLGIFKRTINTLLELYPQNVTVHTLSIKNAAQIRGEEQKFESEVPKMVEYAQKMLMENGYKPYYLYRQKHQLGGLENVGYFRDDTPCMFNIDSMEDVSSVIAIGAGAISKRVFNLENRIEREPNCKFIPDYIARIDEMIEKKVKFFS